MTSASYYVIRHKATGQIMPLMKRGRGYSHWNPGNPKAPALTYALTVPRMLTTPEQAERCIRQWACAPNKTEKIVHSFGTWHDEVDVIEDIKPDGRQKSDLEIVIVILTVP